MPAYRFPDVVAPIPAVPIELPAAQLTPQQPNVAVPPPPVHTRFMTAEVVEVGALPNSVDSQDT